MFSPNAVLVAAVKQIMPVQWDPHVATRVPKTMPGEMVRVSRINGPVDWMGVTEEVRYLCECWVGGSNAEYDSELLAHDVADGLRGLTGHWVSGVFVRWSTPEQPPIRHPDEADRERFQFTGRILLKRP